jgi:long-subunit fatty acid transport protein
MQHVRIFKRFGWAFGAISAAALCANSANAAGIEDTVPGTVALGRAANYARANDFMATWQNPANLALVVDDVGLELRLPIFGACFDRARDNSMTYRPEDSFDEECNDAAPFPAGNLGFAMKLSEKLGLGAGVFTPAGVGSLSFGDDTIVTGVAEQMRPDQAYPITTTGTMSGNRFMLLERNVLAAFLGVGAGYAPIPQLRFGVMLASGFADVAFKNVASLAPGFGDQEILNEVEVADYFIPRVTASVASTPTEKLDLMLAFTWNDDIGAKGHVDLTANGIQGAPLGDCRTKFVDPSSGVAVGKPGPRCRIDDVELAVPYQRFEAVLGIRYADRTVARSSVLDPMTQETWDIELDAFWVNTSHVQTFVLDVYDPAEPADTKPTVQFASDPNAEGLSVPFQAKLPHNWDDTYGVRVGGDYNVLPGKLALRVGAAYETRAVPVKYMSVDYWPVSKVAVHAGLTYRVGPVDLTAAYAHIFNETVDVAVGEGAVREVVAASVDGSGNVVNEGRYRSQIDIISVQGTFRF